MKELRKDRNILRFASRKEGDFPADFKKLPTPNFIKIQKDIKQICFTCISIEAHNSCQITSPGFTYKSEGIINTCRFMINTGVSRQIIFAVGRATLQARDIFTLD